MGSCWRLKGRGKKWQKGCEERRKEGEKEGKKEREGNHTKGTGGNHTKERVLVGPNVRSEDTHTTTEPVERKRWIEK